MARYTQANRPLSLATPLGADALLLEKLTGSERLSTPFCFQLDLLAEQPVEFDKVLGQAVTVTMAQPNGSRRWIHGIVRRLIKAGQVGQARAKLTRYRAELVPALWLLGQRVQSRVFQQQSVLDILKQVLVSDWQLDVKFITVGDYLPRTDCVQYRESDLAFVSRLMEQEGLWYYFRHAESGHTLVITDSSSAGAAELSPPSVRYAPDLNESRDVPRIQEFEIAQELRACKQTAWDYCFELPTSDLLATGVIAESVQVGSVRHRLNLQRRVNEVEMLEIQDGAAGFAHWCDGISPSGGDQASQLGQLFKDNRRVVRLRAEAEAAQALTARGEGTCASFAPGYLVAIEGHFDADDAYLLTSVEHFASLEGVYTTNPDAKPVYRNQFEALPKALPYRPARVTPRPRVQGTLKAVVIGPVADQAFCDKYGRIKVQFPWGVTGKAAAGNSCWVRVAQQWAGQGWGMLTLPRVGHEVVVGFYQGDPDQPCVLGSQYNAAQMPPYTLPEQWRRSGHVSSSGSGVEQYHEICLDDTPGAELLLIHSEKDLKFFAENDHHHNIANDHVLLIGNIMSLKAGPQSTSGGNGNSTGSGSGGGGDTATGVNWTVDNNTIYNYGNQSVLIKGSANTLTFGAQDAFVVGDLSQTVCGLCTAITLGGNLNLNVGGSLNINLPYSLSITKGWALESDTAGKYEFSTGFHIETVEGEDARTITGDCIHTVQGARTLLTMGAFSNNIALDYTTLVEGAMTTDVSGMMNTVVTGVRADMTTGEHTITSAALLTLMCEESMILLTPASLTLKCGMSSITLTPASIDLLAAAIQAAGGSGASSLSLDPAGAAIFGTTVALEGAEVSLV